MLITQNDILPVIARSSLPNTQDSIWISQSSMRCDSYIKYPVVQHAQLVSDTRECTPTTSWIDFLIAIWWRILVMINNGKMSKNGASE